MSSASLNHNEQHLSNKNRLSPCSSTILTNVLQNKFVEFVLNSDFVFNTGCNRITHIEYFLYIYKKDVLEEKQ